ncbi:MAG: hypothetical protein QM756_14660 [Polyangiaceae bacterium]
MPKSALETSVKYTFGFGLLASSTLTTGLAAAQEAKPEDDVQLCATAFEQAQRFRNETKYIAANQEVLKCANPKCGDALFQECTKMYSELQAAMPTVVFGAREGSKNDELFDVAVSVDGQPVVDQLDGKAIPIDPGNHMFKFTSPKFPPVRAPGGDSRGREVSPTERDVRRCGTGSDAHPSALRSRACSSACGPEAGGARGARRKLGLGRRGRGRPWRLRGLSHDRLQPVRPAQGRVRAELP